MPGKHQPVHVPFLRAPVRPSSTTATAVTARTRPMYGRFQPSVGPRVGRCFGLFGTGWTALATGLGTRLEPSETIDEPITRQSVIRPSLISKTRLK